MDIVERAEQLLAVEHHPECDGYSPCCDAWMAWDDGTEVVAALVAEVRRLRRDSANLNAAITRALSGWPPFADEVAWVRFAGVRQTLARLNDDRSAVRCRAARPYCGHAAPGRKGCVECESFVFPEEGA